MIDTAFTGDTARMVCPFCSHTRRKSRLKEMTLTRQADGAVLYYCHHCDANGSVQPEERKLAVVPKLQVMESVLEEPDLQYLQSRGISKATAEKYKLFAGRKWFARLNKEADCIGFPYYRTEPLLGSSTDPSPKKTSPKRPGSARLLRFRQHHPDRPIIIVEGEIDALTLHECGVENVLSVPGGAPRKGGRWKGPSL
jgi:twinkle protein